MRSDGDGNETGDLWNTADINIKVRKQRLVNLTVGVTNNEDVSTTSVLVDFYIDGEYIGNNTIPNIPGGATENATVAWDATFMKDGEYQMRAVIDPLGHITEIDQGNNEVTRTIYLGGPPEPEDLTLYYTLGGVAVIAVAGVTVLWFWRRRQYRF
jgi:subtilase family serine protease